MFNVIKTNRGFMIIKIEQDKINEIIEIEREAFNDSWSLETYNELYKNYNTNIYVYYDELEIIAYAVFLDMVDVYELVKIAVKKEFRGKKYGSKFLADVINKFDKNIFLEVREGNIFAIKLYESIGFQRVNIRKNYYRDTGENAVIMIYDR